MILLTVFRWCMFFLYGDITWISRHLKSLAIQLFSDILFSPISNLKLTINFSFKCRTIVGQTYTISRIRHYYNFRVVLCKTRCICGKCVWHIKILMPIYWFISRDVMTWKRFPHYRRFVRGIHPSPTESPHKVPVIRFFYVCFYVRFDKVEKK